MGNLWFVLPIPKHKFHIHATQNVQTNCMGVEPMERLIIRMRELGIIYTHGEIQIR